MAYNHVWYIHYGNGTSTGYYAVATRPQNVAVAAGQLARQFTAPAYGSERCFVCIVAGTTANTADATWSTASIGQKTTDGTATWQECSGQPGVNGDPTNTPSWATGVANQNVGPGQVIKNNAGTFLFICSTNGATQAAEPTWNTTTGATTSTTGGAVFTCIGAVSAFTTTWGAPHARMQNAFSANWSVAGDDFYVADNSAENAGANPVTLNPPATFAAPCRVMSIDHTASLPPTAASVKAGASATSASTGNSGIGISSSSANAVYFYGLTLIESSSSPSYPIVLCATPNCYLRMEACSLQLSANFTGQFIAVGGAGGGPSTIDLVNCSFSFANAGQRIQVSGNTVTWRATASALLGTMPSALTQLYNSGIANVLIEGVDLSALGANTLVNNANSGGGYVVFKDCKIASSAVVIPAPATQGVNLTVDLMRCDSGGTNYRNERHAMYGDETTAATVARTGGASDGTTPVSHRVAPSSFARTYSPFNAIPLVIWNAVVGTNRQISLYGVANAAALPTNADFWFDVEYLGDAASPKGSFASSGRATQLTAASAWTADASAWDSAAPARQNSNAYAVGAVIKLASNPGRVFFCIASSGNSAGSEPGGYATAVDGGSVTDGSCTFRAGMRFSALLTLSSPQPAQAGYFTVYPKFGTNVAAAIHIDPLIVLS